jgi:hypothetical protein
MCRQLPERYLLGYPIPVMCKSLPKRFLIKFRRLMHRLRPRLPTIRFVILLFWISVCANSSPNPPVADSLIIDVYNKCTNCLLLARIITSPQG